jgi:hypothetical protein
LREVIDNLENEIVKLRSKHVAIQSNVTNILDKIEADVVKFLSNTLDISNSIVDKFVKKTFKKYTIDSGSIDTIGCSKIHAILKLHDESQLSRRAIGKLFGYSANNIGHIVRGETHVRCFELYQKQKGEANENGKK